MIAKLALALALAAVIAEADWRLWLFGTVLALVLLMCLLLGVLWACVTRRLDQQMGDIERRVLTRVKKLAQHRTD